MNQLIANRYEIQAALGEGGMGAVVKAHDSLLGITVAIKQLHQETRSETLLRFQTEAVALAKLNHPNIVKIFDFARHGNSTYMVMEFLDGESLADFIMRNQSERNRTDDTQLSVVEALEIMVDICEALGHAHKNGVLHRDLKPSNIMLVFDDQGIRYAKVVDFGIARLVQREQDLTGTGVGIGSPSYMSPEQITNTDVDTRADIYSFGCVMFEALRGFPPLKGETAMETAQKHLHEMAPLLSYQWNGKEFPGTLIDVVEKCLRKKPDERFQSFRELQNTLAEVLEQLISEDGDTADSTASLTVERSENKDSGIVPGARTTKQKRFVALFALLGLVIVVIGGVSFFLRTHFEPVSASRVRVAFGGPLPKNMPDGLAEKLRNADLKYGSSTVRKDSSELDLSAGIDSLETNHPRLIHLGNHMYQLDDISANDMKLMAPQISNGEALSIKNSHVNASIISTVANLKPKILVIEKCTLDLQAKDSIAELATVENLYFKECDDIKDADLAHLHDRKNLKLLYLAQLKSITNSGIAGISHLSHLEELMLEEIPINDGCISSLGKLNNLKGIGVIHNKDISESGIVQLLNQRKKLVKFLYTPGGAARAAGQLGEAVINALTRQEIENLFLEDVSITSDQLVELCTIKSLKTLTLQIPSLDTPALVALGKLPVLNRLTITGAQNLTLGHMKQLSTLGHLVMLEFFNCNLMDEHLKPLESMKTLKHIVAKRCPVSDEAVADLNWKLKK